MQNAKILTLALALAGLGFLGAGTAFAEEHTVPVGTTPASGATILADDDDDWDDWHDDDWDDRWDD
jgi:hypothetical protein